MKTLYNIITALCFTLFVAAFNSCTDYPDEAFFFANMSLEADYDNITPNEDGTYNIPILCSLDFDKASEEIETAYIEYYNRQQEMIRVDVTDIATSKSRTGSIVLENLKYNSENKLAWTIETSSFSNTKEYEVYVSAGKFCKVVSVEVINISPCGATLKGTTNIKGYDFITYNAISASDDPSFKENARNFDISVNKNGEFSQKIGMFDQNTKVYYRVDNEIQNSFTTSENLADISVHFYMYSKEYNMDVRVDNDRSGLTDIPKYELWTRGSNSVWKTFKGSSFNYGWYNKDAHFQIVYYRGNTPLAILDDVVYPQ